MLSGKGFELWQHCSHGSLNTSYVRPPLLTTKLCPIFHYPIWKLDSSSTRQVFDKTVGCRPVINKHLVNRSQWLKVIKKILVEVCFTIFCRQNSRTISWMLCSQFFLDETFLIILQSLCRTNFYCRKVHEKKGKTFDSALNGGGGKGIVFNSCFNAFPSVLLCF